MVRLFPPPIHFNIIFLSTTMLPERPLSRFRKQSVSRPHMPLFLSACYMSHPIQLQKCNHKFDSGSNTSDLYCGSDRCYYPEVLRGFPQHLSRMCGASTLTEATDASFQILSTPKSSYLTILRYTAQGANNVVKPRDKHRPWRGNKSVPE